MTDNYSLDTEYISIYDKKPRGTKPLGRPKIYTEEEIKQKKRDNASKYFNEHYEYVKLKNNIQTQLRYHANKVLTS